MSVAGIMVLIAMALGVLTFVTWPLITQAAASNSSQYGDQSSPADGGQLAANLAALHSTYDQTLTTIRDLDFDFQTGKLLAEDHRQQRATLVATAADLLRKIDLLRADSVEAAVTKRRISRAAAQQAEAAIAQKRAQPKPPNL